MEETGEERMKAELEQEKEVGLGLLQFPQMSAPFLVTCPLQGCAHCSLLPGRRSAGGRDVVSYEASARSRESWSQSGTGTCCAFPILQEGWLGPEGAVTVGALLGPP